MYAYIIDKIVREVIPDIDPIFPGIDINERYPADMLAKCVHVDDRADVKQGMVYDAESGTFSMPEVKPIITNIDDAKVLKVAESKEKLAEWLENNPMLYTDGKLYSVTAEKQSLLNSNLSSYERAKAAGIDYPLKWNSTGEECTEYSYEKLVGLSLAIASYVAPKVSAQQEIELAINACSTLDEINAVVIDYDNHTSEN